MRRLASTLDVEAMSLYHHLPGKDALLDGLGEMVVAEVAQAKATLADVGERSVALRQRCLAARTVMLRHPWAPALIGTRTNIPPGVYAHYESILATMIQGGLSCHLAHRAVHALGSMALGFIQELFAPASAGSVSVEPSEEELAAILSELPHLTGGRTATARAGLLANSMHRGVHQRYADEQAVETAADHRVVHRARHGPPVAAGRRLRASRPAGPREPARTARVRDHVDLRRVDVATAPNIHAVVNGRRTTNDPLAKTTVMAVPAQRGPRPVGGCGLGRRTRHPYSPLPARSTRR